MTDCGSVMTLQILPPKPFCYCMPWHGRWDDGEKYHGATCCFCNRDVAAPKHARGKNVACIYCGLDRGRIPEAEIEP